MKELTMEKTNLEVGDKIRRWELSEEMEFTYEITSVTKTLAKTDDENKVFFREISYNVIKPNEKCLGSVRKKGENYYWGKTYFLIKE